MREQNMGRFPEKHAFGAKKLAFQAKKVAKEKKKGGRKEGAKKSALKTTKNKRGRSKN